METRYTDLEEEVTTENMNTEENKKSNLLDVTFKNKIEMKFIQPLYNRGQERRTVNQIEHNLIQWATSGWKCAPYTSQH